MSGLRGIVALLLVVVLVSGAALSVAQEMRLDQIATSAQIVQARQEAAVMRQRLAEMETGVGQSGPDLPTLIAEDELDAELVLQDRLLTLAREFDINPLSFGGGPMPVEVSHAAVAFSFEFETGHDRAIAFVEAVEQSEPAMALHGVWIRQLPIGSLGDLETPVSVRLSLWSFWLDVDAGQGG